MRISQQTIEVPPGRRVSSVWAVPDGFAAGTTPALVIGHGAGNDMHNPFLSHVHESLAEAGWLTVKFNFPYKEAGRKAPDRAPLLEATYRAVLESVRMGPEGLPPGPLYLGGKSMGGRIASHLVAQGEAAAGLVFLGYPLHPPRQPDKLRVAHLPEITRPLLFIQGTRDALCDLDLLREVLKTLKAPTTLHAIQDGDHSFNVLKRTGRAQQDVWREIVQAVLEWRPE